MSLLTSDIIMLLLLQKTCMYMHIDYYVRCYKSRINSLDHITLYQGVIAYIVSYSGTVRQTV